MSNNNVVTFLNKMSNRSSIFISVTASKSLVSAVKEDKVVVGVVVVDNDFDGDNENEDDED